MSKYIIIWDVNDYPDMGGGVNFELFENIKQVENKVNDLMKDSKTVISFCGKITDEIKFKPVEKIIKWEIIQQI